MNEKILMLIILFIGLPTFFIGNNPSKNKPLKKVVIDAGHGGEDSGALGKISKEKDIALAIALKVGGYIENNMPDIQVIYTRKTDVFLPLNERAHIANNNNADLFVSIHVNSNPNPAPTGTETYAMGLHKTQGNLEVAQKENSVITYEKDYNTVYEGFDPNSAESYIIFSLIQNKHLENSLNVAAHVQDEFRDRAMRKDRGVKQAGFLVLWHTTMPSILIETGFISNPHEEKYLNSEEGQDHLSSAIYRAIKSYFVKLGQEESTVIRVNETDLQEDIKPQQPNPIQTIINTDQICYRVQIASSTKPLDKSHMVFKNYTDIFEYKEGDTYKYTVGKYLSFSDVKIFQVKVKNDFPGAFIVAFKNNKRIDIKEAMQTLN